MSISPTTWDPGYLSPPAVLSNGNIRLLSGGGGTYASTRSKHPIVGNVYFSAAVRTDAAGAVAGVGITDATFALTSTSNWSGNSSSGAMWGPNGSIYLSGSVVFTQAFTANPQNIEIAVRVDTRRVWVRRSGQAWIGGGNPAANTSPTFTVPGSGALYAAATVSTGGATSNRYVDLFADPALITGTPPAGFEVGISDGTSLQIISQIITLRNNVNNHFVKLAREVFSQSVTLTGSVSQNFNQHFLFHQAVALSANISISLFKSINGFGEPLILFQESDEIEQISLTFDQLGRPLVFYRIGSDTLKLHWYDPLLQQTVSSVIATGIDPQAGFDFPQDTGQSFTDVLLFYQRNGTIYMRIQRERFAIEYECPVTKPGITLISNGLRVDNRYQVVYEYLAEGYEPPIVPVPEIPVTGDNIYLHSWGSCLISNHNIDVVSQPFKLGFTVRDAFYPRGPQQYMFGSDDRNQLSCFMGSGSVTIYRGHRWGASKLIVPDDDFNGEWEFEFFGLNGDVLIKKDGNVLFDDFLVRPQPGKARPTNIVFAGTETKPGAECLTLRGAVSNCWVEQGGTRIDWPVQTKGEALQPSVPPGTDMLIKNHRQQNWIRRS